MSDKAEAQKWYYRWQESAGGKSPHDAFLAGYAAASADCEAKLSVYWAWAEAELAADEHDGWGHYDCEVCKEVNDKARSTREAALKAWIEG